MIIFAFGKTTYAILFDDAVFRIRLLVFCLPSCLARLFAQLLNFIANTLPTYILYLGVKQIFFVTYVAKKALFCALNSFKPIE